MSNLSGLLTTAETKWPLFNACCTKWRPVGPDAPKITSLGKSSSAAMINRLGCLHFDSYVVKDQTVCRKKIAYRICSNPSVKKDILLMFNAIDLRRKQKFYGTAWNLNFCLICFGLVLNAKISQQRQSWKPVQVSKDKEQTICGDLWIANYWASPRNTWLFERDGLTSTRPESSLQFI